MSLDGEIRFKAMVLGGAKVEITAFGDPDDVEAFDVSPVRISGSLRREFSRDEWAVLSETGDIEPLLERIRVCESVIDAAKGPDSTSRSVAAIDAYEEKYGDVPATYRPPWRGGDDSYPR